MVSLRHSTIRGCITAVPALTRALDETAGVQVKFCRMRTEFRQATTPDKAWSLEAADRRHGRCQALSCLKGGKIFADESLKPGNFCPTLLERKNAGTDPAEKCTGSPPTRTL